MVVRSLQVKESCAIQKDVGIVQRGVEGLSRYCAARLGSQMRIANCLNSMKLSACCVEKGAFTRIFYYCRRSFNLPMPGVMKSLR